MDWARTSDVETAVGDPVTGRIGPLSGSFSIEFARLVFGLRRSLPSSDPELEYQRRLADLRVDHLRGTLSEDRWRTMVAKAMISLAKTKDSHDVLSGFVSAGTMMERISLGEVSEADTAVLEAAALTRVCQKELRELSRRTWDQAAITRDM